jgi:organic radical activating enzyme
MNKITERLSSLFKPKQLIEAGVYHFQTPSDADLQYRLHLRINHQGEGVLIINASTILHLNQTATEYAYHIVQETSVEETASQIAQRYQVDQNQARTDYLDFREKIRTLLEIPDLDPVSFLDISREDPYSGTIEAPYRLDCALTYQLPEKSNPELAPIRRVDRELSTEEWMKIIDHAWQAGVPHLIFTGGEPTLRDDLIDLIKHAEKNGQVTGLLTDGYKLIDADFRHDLLQSGLDHLLFALSPSDKESWDALKAILDEDLHTTVHLTIKPDYLTKISRIFSDLKDFGANAVSLSIQTSGDQKMSQALADARTELADLGLPLKWDLPVPYSEHNPINIELEFEQEVPAGAGKAWYYVEPDGDLLPAQGINEVLGNLLTDDLNKLW